MFSFKKLLILPLSFFSILALSQSKEAKTINKVGIKYYNNGDYEKAIDQFEQIANEYSQNAKFHYMLGISYLHCYTRKKDLEYIEKANSIDPNVFPDITFWLGRANHLNYNFTKANRYYNEYAGKIKKHQINLALN